MWRNKILKRVTGILALMLVVVGLVAAAPRHLTVALPQVQEPAPLDGAQDVAVVSAGNMLPRAYLPLVFRDYGPRSSRLGYCALSPNISNYADVGKLAAGWYVRFEAKSDVPRPRGMDYVQVVRLHQETTCWPTRTRDRAEWECPYVRPYNYIITSPASATREQGLAQLTAIAGTNPGMLWLIGNEMDRRDWEGGGQDEMLPELYARAYHEIRDAIKAGDPTAQVGIGGMVQATDARLYYLTKVWDAYPRLYNGADMPVDVWNVHNFIFKEHCNDYGADMPPGDARCEGTLYSDADHNNMVIFNAQIRAFRQWMKDHGQQQKPLIVSEYGIVYRHAGMNSQSLVQSFLTNTFDYFMNTKDCNLGYAADQCRLVQRWAWYSLDDNNPNFNSFAYLIDPTTGRLTATGQTFMEYAQRYLDVR